MSFHSPDSLAIVLIHGSWHGSWCWERLTPLLGGRALAIDLPGRLSHGANGLAAISLGDWADAVEAAARTLSPRPLILVGHSMGALTLPVVAARLADQVRHVVYLAGVAPDEGRCAGDLFLPRLPFSSGPLSAAPAAGTLPPRLALRWMLCNDLDPATTDWLLARLAPSPARPALTRISWRGFAWPCPVTYIAPTRDRALSSQVRQRSLANLPGAQLIELDGGHELMLSRPAELAKLLIEL